MTILEMKDMTGLFLGLDVDSFTLLDCKIKDQELHVKIKKEDFISTHIFGRKSSSSLSFEDAIKPDYNTNPQKVSINKNIYWN